MAETEIGLDGLLPNHPSGGWRELVDTLRQRSAPWAVVVGAGLSVGAGIPDWMKLTHGAMTKFGLTIVGDGPHANGLASVLGECADKGQDAFWSHVKSEVCKDAAPTPAQHSVCQLPFDLFVTLNYDKLLETNWSRYHKSSVMAFPDIRPSDLGGDSKLVYLHGRCPDGPNKLSEATAVMTKKSYLLAYAPNQQLDLAVRSLFSDFNVLFLGVGFGDPDIAEIMRAFERTGLGYEARPPRTWLSAASTAETTYFDGLDRTFRGYGSGIKPLWYHSPNPSDHSNLSTMLDSMVRLAATND